MKPLRYIERKISGLFEGKYKKCNTKEDVLKEQKKTEKRIKWADRALDAMFITYSTLNAVFDSQILSLLNYFSKKHKFYRLILCLGYKENIEKKELLIKNLFQNIEVVFFHNQAHANCKE